ncbi:MAG: hypothetical protein SOZ34_00415 [Clostridia bacterium]|nr:hypothetical protein [Clostridia bacterium]
MKGLLTRKISGASRPSSELVVHVYNGKTYVLRCISSSDKIKDFDSHLSTSAFRKRTTCLRLFHVGFVPPHGGGMED